MQRAIELCRHFKVPVMVCINKFDLNLENSDRIEALAREGDLPVVGRVPYDPVFTRAMVQGKTLFEYDGEGSAAEHLRLVWKRIMNTAAMTAE
jgi:MinD superfamily P-loop ATPase